MRCRVVVHGTPCRGATHEFSGSRSVKRNALIIWPTAYVLALVVCLASWADEPTGAVRFRDHVQPILENYCYGCHGYGASEGGRTFDEFASDEAMLANVDLWHAVLKNVRAGLMPPAGEDAPSDAQRKQIQDWIEADVFDIDPADPDPGRVTLRRLNRVEYRHTIQDLMGIDYNTTEEFPPDDSGYGFDNIADVLTVSPLLLEKYVQAAETIVRRAVPTVSKKPQAQQFSGSALRSEDGSKNGATISFYDETRVTHPFKIKRAGDYRLVAKVRSHGGFFFDPGRCEVTFSIDDRELLRQEYVWAENKSFNHDFDVRLEPGEHRIALHLRPLAERQASDDDERGKEELRFHIDFVRVEGPMDKKDWIAPPNYARFFPGDPPSAPGVEQDAYARYVLARFAGRAFRRPVDEATLDRLAAVAKQHYQLPGTTLEEGVGQAMIAVLASPRFLFRVEEVAPASPDEPFPPIDDFALASRLSYFLWSTMPDDELWELAEQGKLRDELDERVKRMVRDPRSERFVENFVGQWLQARDVGGAGINAIAVLGHQQEWEELLKRVREMRRERRRSDRDNEPDADGEASQRQRSSDSREVRRRFRELASLNDKYNAELWRSMRRETELTFQYVFRQNRSLLELLDSDYTFLNERLAEHYGIDGVEGRRMRRVELPPDSPLGGILTQGAVLVVTSNPTRTSPVKRGLFVLDNILGTPAPPPPGPVPLLEDSATAFTDHEPTLRELLETHRSEPLCFSCHARMDPLGLALENFNALGMWRDTEQGQPIDTSGELITGETFENFAELKRILVNQRRLDFYRCVSEKMLTYALGRGLEYHDEHTIDQLAERLERHEGRIFELLLGIVRSAPFQRARRTDAAVASHDAVETIGAAIREPAR